MNLPKIDPITTTLLPAPTDADRARVLAMFPAHLRPAGTEARQCAECPTWFICTEGSDATLCKTCKAEQDSMEVDL